MKTIFKFLFLSIIIFSCSKDSESPQPNIIPSPSPLPTPSGSGFDRFYLLSMDPQSYGGVDSIVIKNVTNNFTEVFNGISSTTITCDTGNDDKIELSIANEPNIGDSCLIFIYHNLPAISTTLPVILFFGNQSTVVCDQYGGNFYQPDSTILTPTCSIFEVIVDELN